MQLVKESELEKEDGVLIVGLGAIGLMAASIARSQGLRVWGAELSAASVCLARAPAAGVADVILTDKDSISPICSKHEIRRIMITAPPAVLPHAVEAIGYGGVITYVGLAQKTEETIPLNMNHLLRKKVTIRPVYAVPSLYAKETMRALESGVIDSRSLMSLPRCSWSGRAERYRRPFYPRPPSESSRLRPKSSAVVVPRVVVSLWWIRRCCRLRRPLSAAIRVHPRPSPHPPGLIDDERPAA